MGLLNNLPAVDANNSYREDIENAYFKIEGCIIDTNKQKVRIPVRGWLSEYARQNQGIGIFKRVFYAPIDFFADTLCTVDALCTKGYDYIKSLPEFENATDVTEEYSGDIDITEEIAEEQEKTLEELIKSLKD